MSRRGRALLAALAAVVVLTGCSSLPESGPVHRAEADRSDRPQDAPYFNPPGPAEDGSPAAIVSGFLVAMQANPLSTSTARKFLSEKARTSWRPDRGTVVYDAFTVDTNSTGADLRLTDTRRLDARGGWRGGAPGRSETLVVEMVSENGQWRIDNPVNALVVPTSFFDRSFARYNLYFFDQTGRVLLPDPVFLPRGDQIATNLVRGLLAGPGRTIDAISRTALPPRTGLDLSVVVTESGVAEVPLTREALEATPRDLSRAVDQLAWTLRQVPGVERVRITVDGAPVPLPGGRIDASVSVGAELDAGSVADGRLWALRGGRVVDLDSTSADAVPGPFGKAAYSLRSLAMSQSRRVAAVSGDGTGLYVGPADDSVATIFRPVRDGTDLLRPSYDLFGDLWLVDRTERGARLRVLSGGRVRTLRVPGVTGSEVVAFSVARDGSRLAVAYAGSPTPSVRVTDVLRTDEGIVSGAGPSRVLRAPEPGPDPEGDGERVVDIGWRDPGTLAVLSRPSEETSRVRFLSVDGSPTPASLREPSVFRGAASAMVVSPDIDLPLRLITPDQRLYTLDSAGNWPRTSSRVASAAYAR